MQVTSPTMPQDSQQPSRVAREPASNPGRSMTAAAYWAQLLYVPWLVVMFVLAYAVIGILGVGESVAWTSQGLLGWVFTLVYAAVVAFPNWLGAGLALRARKSGAGPAATVALWQNLIVGITIAVLVVIAS
jgi:hypothetical protein